MLSMKKISSIILLLALLFAAGTTLSAAPVPAERALEIGKKFFAAQPATKAGGGAVRIIWDGESGEPATKASAEPAFYVIAREGGGFVIIAGDDNVQPVLAFSDRNPFKVEDMPANVKWWMNNLKRIVRSSAGQTPEVRRMWSDLTGTKSTVFYGVTDEFLGSRTVEWDQAGVANAKCPTINYSKTICGCLPLAMAEILTWHGWPERGTGKLEGYKYTSGVGLMQKTISIPGYELTTEYDWENLRTIRCSQNSEEDTFYNLDPHSPIYENLSQLVYDCGVMLQVEFNTEMMGGTGATDSRIVGSFGTYMSYNKAAHMEYVDDYALSTWVSMLKEEIHKRPVLYCGYASEGGGIHAGHAYVLDGYATFDGADVFHVNFGWGSICNGYYCADSQHAQNPDWNEAQGDPDQVGYQLDYDFNLGLRALFDFFPDETGNTSFIMNLKFYPATFQFTNGKDTWTDTFFGLTLDEGSLAPGQQFAFKTGGIYNAGSAPFTGKIEFFLVKGNGDIYFLSEETLDYSSDPLLPDGFDAAYSKYYYVFDEDDIGFGDRLVAYYTLDEQYYEQLVAYINDGTVLEEMPVVPMPYIRPDVGYTAGEVFPLRLFNCDTIYPYAVWKFTAPSGTKTTVNQYETKYDLNEVGQYSVTVKPYPEAETVATHFYVSAVPTPTPASAPARDKFRATSGSGSHKPAFKKLDPSKVKNVRPDAAKAKPRSRK